MVMITNAQAPNSLLDVSLVLKMAKVSERKKVADLGCGSTGFFTFGPAKLVGKNGKVYAVDILKPILEKIKRQAKQENFENIETIWSDLEMFNATKIEAGSLDVGLLVNTLYQSHKRAEIIRESIRMIKKGGMLAIVEWKDSYAPFGPPIEERVKKGLLVQAANKLGLQLEEEFEAGPYHYGVVFIKL